MHEGKKQFDSKFCDKNFEKNFFEHTHFFNKMKERSHLNVCFVTTISQAKVTWVHTLVQFMKERYHLNAIFVARNLQENIPWKYKKAGNGWSQSKSLTRWKMWK